MTLKVALIETGTSHDECLYAQIKYLRTRLDIKLDLICSPSIYARTRHFDQLDDIRVLPRHSGLAEWLDLLRLRHWLIQGRYNKVIINTAQGKTTKMLAMLPFPRNIEFIGILHDIRKLQNSTGQKIISRRIKKYFVLNDTLRAKAEALKLSHLAFGTTYPIFFPPCPEQPLPKGRDELWICIPGQVELKRRDYESLLHALERIRLPASIKFILLGKSAHQHGDGPYIRERIQTLGLENHFRLWDEFVDTETFCAYMQNCDYVLPLIHPQHVSAGLYANQITGGYNLAFGYRKVLLMERHAQVNPDLCDNTLFYDLDNLGPFLAALTQPDAECYRDSKWQLDTQASEYWRLLDLKQTA